jgi:hypothetical protein
MNNDIVFKPQKFIFDLSLFHREAEVVDLIKPAINEGFSSLLTKATVKDFVDINTNIFYTLDGKKIAGVTTTSIKEDKKYNFLSNKDREDLIKNHFESLLIENYVKLSTGMSIEESSFPIDDSKPSYTLDSEFESLLIGYIKNILGKNIPQNQTVNELLLSNSIDQATKDLLRSVAMTCPLVSPFIIKDRVLKPKKYDRVLNVAVNIDDYEIDVEQTRKTTSGQKALNQAGLQKQIRIVKEGTQEKQYLTQRTEKDIIFEDYMIIVENKL